MNLSLNMLIYLCYEKLFLVTNFFLLEENKGAYLVIMCTICPCSIHLQFQQAIEIALIHNSLCLFFQEWREVNVSTRYFNVTHVICLKSQASLYSNCTCFHANNSERSRQTGSHSKIQSKTHQTPFPC